MKEQAWYVDSDQLKEMLFPEAAEIWLATKAPYISAKTFREYSLNIRTLSVFFLNTRLCDIGADQIRRFQNERSTRCGAFSINHECGLIQQMLRRVGVWGAVAPQYEPLPLPKESVGRVLTTEERKRLFEAAQGDPNLESALLFAMLAVNTTGGPKEIATLRLKDVELETRTVFIQGTKNADRVRKVPLNDEAQMAATLAVGRARRLGSTQPEHHLFPYRAKSKGRPYDPTRYQTTFKTAWKRILTKAGIDGRLRMYDLRHTAITIMLESPDVSEETVESIAGHVSKKIKKVYSHIRMAQRRCAVSALDGSSAPQTTRMVQPADALTNDRVRNMLSNGLSGRIVAERIKKAPATAFDISDEALNKLNADGIPECVILAMVRA